MMTPAPVRHFLSIDDLRPKEVLMVLDLADQLKAARPRPGTAPIGAPNTTLAGHSIALIFEKPSTRTRVSFEVGVAELGGHPVVLNADQIQLGRGETISDTAQVLSRYVHAIVLRTFGHDRLEIMAEAGTVPVINALSDLTHPCQALADLQTIRARTGRLQGLKLAYVGDGNNVAHSLLKAGAMMDMHVAVATPEGYAPNPQIIDEATELAQAGQGRITVTTDPATALADADVVYTDVWASMGHEDEAQERASIFAPYQINTNAMAHAGPDAIVMHCLPAHRGEEITTEVLEGDHSVVFEQAENRLHAQKALLVTLLEGL